MISESERKRQFKIKFDKHYSLLCNVAYGFVPDKDDCEDIVQETFISVWDKEKDLLPEKEFASYMVSSVKNNCISFLRKRKLDTVSMEDPTLIPANLSHDDAEDEREMEKYNALEEALASLPQKCREVFLMSKLKGMKYKEIASATGISEKTVENHMGKAMKILREYVAANPLIIILIIKISIHLMSIKR